MKFCSKKDLAQDYDVAIPCAGSGTTKNLMPDAHSEATEDEIAVCAYYIWEQEGKPERRALDHWLQAELQLAASLWHESLWHKEGANDGRFALT